MQPVDFHRATTEAVLPALWLLAKDLGVAKVPKLGTGWPVDPEATLIGVLSIGRADPRLFDAVLSWWRQYEHVVDVGRLDGLVARAHPHVATVLGAWIAAGREPAPSRWRRFTGGPRSDEAAAPRPLFVDLDGVFLSDLGDNDAIFAKWGWSRGGLTADETWVRSEPRSAHRLREWSRLVVGPGVRAEILTTLTMTPDTSAPRLIADAGCSPRAAHSVLADLRDAGIVTWDGRRGGSGRVRLDADLRAFFGPLIPRHDPRVVGFENLEHREWSAFFVGLSHLWSGSLAIVQRGAEGFEAESRYRDVLEATLPHWQNLHGAPSDRDLTAGVPAAQVHVVEFVQAYATVPASSR